MSQRQRSTRRGAKLRLVELLHQGAVNGLDVLLVVPVNAQLAPPTLDGREEKRDTVRAEAEHVVWCLEMPDGQCLKCHAQHRVQHVVLENATARPATLVRGPREAIAQRWPTNAKLRNPSAGTRLHVVLREHCRPPVDAFLVRAMLLKDCQPTWPLRMQKGRW